MLRRISILLHGPTILIFEASRRSSCSVPWANRRWLEICWRAAMPWDQTGVRSLENYMLQCFQHCAKDFPRHLVKATSRETNQKKRANQRYTSQEECAGSPFPFSGGDRLGLHGSQCRNQSSRLWQLSAVRSRPTSPWTSGHSRHLLPSSSPKMWDVRRETMRQRLWCDGEKL